MKNKNIIRIALVTAFILLMPLVAMQFSAEVDWNLFDFVVAGTLLFGSGLTYELIASKAGNTAYRAAVGVAVAAALLLVWINLAVGIIGSEDNPVNADVFLGDRHRNHRRGHRAPAAAGNGARLVRDGVRPGVGPRDRADHRQVPVSLHAGSLPACWAYWP